MDSFSNEKNLLKSFSEEMKTENEQKIRMFMTNIR